MEELEKRDGSVEWGAEVGKLSLEIDALNLRIEVLNNRIENS